MSTKVSVILPVYNGETYIQAAIESILDQTFRDFELIVVDDGSTDSTLTMVEEYKRKDDRVIVLKQKNSGIVAALNNGIAQSRGEFIARMDADDIALPTRLTKQVSYLEVNPKVAVLGTQMATFGVGIKRKKRSKYPCKPKAVAKAFKNGRNPVCHPSVMMRRPILEDVGGYRPFFGAAQDYDLWLRISNKYAIANLPDILLRYRSHDESVSNRKAESQNYFRALATYFASQKREDQPDLLEKMKGEINPSILHDLPTQMELKDLLRHIDLYSRVKSGQVETLHFTSPELCKSLSFLKKGFLGGGRQEMAMHCERVFEAAFSLGDMFVARKALGTLRYISSRKFLQFLLRNKTRTVLVFLNVEFKNKSK